MRTKPSTSTKHIHTGGFTKSRRMTTEESLNAKSSSKSFDAELRKDLRKSLALAFPTLLIGMSVGWLKDRISNQPGQALWIVLPGIVILSLIFLSATTRQKLKLG